MKTKILLFCLFFSIPFFAAAQLFQEHFLIAGRHFHGVNADQLKSPSNDLIFSGNFFDHPFSNPLMEV